MKLFAIMAVALASLAPTTAEAGRRCHRTYQTIQSTHGWGQSCYSCHHRQEQDIDVVVADALGKLAKTKQAFEALDSGLDKLGYAPKGYGSSGYGSYRAQGEVTYTPQGPTVYGYNAYTSKFAQTDTDALYARAARLVENAQKLAGQANLDHSALVHAAGEQQARVAEIIVKGQAVERAFRSMDGVPEQPQWRSMRFDISSDGQLRVEPQQGEAGSLHTTAEAPEDGLTASARDALLVARCVDCHGPGKTSGGLDLSPEGVAAWEPGERVSILTAIKERVTHPDPAKRMPLGPDGGEGTPLPLDEKQLLFDWR